MAIAKIMTDDFGSLLTPIHRKIFTQSYYDAAAKQYPSFMKVIDMGKASETFQHLGGFGLPLANTEGNTINEDAMSEGYSATLTSVRYDKGYDITHEMLKQDLVGVFGGAGKFGNAKVSNAPQMLGKSFATKEEMIAAGVLTGGFGNTGYDGVASFNASHPLADSTGTASNLATGALTPSNLKLAITRMRTDSVDEANLISVVRPKKLLVPAALEFTAYEILGSPGQAFEMSNTQNSIGGIAPFVSDYIGETGDTYAATNWFLYSDDVENIIFGWYERPGFGVQEIPRTIDLFAYGYTHYAAGMVNFRGVVGSTGV